MLLDKYDRQFVREANGVLVGTSALTHDGNIDQQLLDAAMLQEVANPIVVAKPTASGWKFAALTCHFLQTIQPQDPWDAKVLEKHVFAK